MFNWRLFRGHKGRVFVGGDTQETAAARAETNNSAWCFFYFHRQRIRSVLLIL